MQEISKKMKNVEIKNSRKRKECESFSTDENVKITRKNDESSLEDLIEDFTDDEAESSDKTNKLPDLDEEVIRGFDQNGLIVGKIDSQDVNEQLSQNADYYMDADDEGRVKIVETTRKPEKILQKRNDKRQAVQKTAVALQTRSQNSMESISSVTNESPNDGDGDVFYDALPEIKTKPIKSKAVKKSNASSTGTSRYRTRAKQQNIDYKDDPGLSDDDDDTLQDSNTEKHSDIENENQNSDSTIKTPQNHGKKPKKFTVTKMLSKDENFAKRKNAPKQRPDQTKDSTFLSDILDRIAQASQNDITIDDVTIDEEVLGMWEDAKDVFETDDKKASHVESFGFSQLVKDVRKQANTKATISKGSPASNLRSRSPGNIKKDSKIVDSIGKISQQKDAVADTTMESDTDTFSDISSRHNFESTSTNPFARITRNFGKDVSMKGGGDARVFSDDVTSDNSEEDVEKVTQKSASTIRTHISDVDLVGFFTNEGEKSNADPGIETETFGAFTNVVRDIHSQNSQKISTGFSQPNLDDLLSEDDSETSDTFAKVFESPKKDGYMSPLSTDDEEDNFAAMFGFKSGKNTKKKRWCRAGFSYFK